jgi:hypothetical protein
MPPRGSNGEVKKIAIRFDPKYDSTKVQATSLDAYINLVFDSSVKIREANNSNKVTIRLTGTAIPSIPGSIHFAQQSISGPDVKEGTVVAATVMRKQGYSGKASIKFTAEQIYPLGVFDPPNYTLLTDEILSWLDQDKSDKEIRVSLTLDPRIELFDEQLPQPKLEQIKLKLVQNPDETSAIEIGQPNECIITIGDATDFTIDSYDGIPLTWTVDNGSPTSALKLGSVCESSTIRLHGAQDGVQLYASLTTGSSIPIKMIYTNPVDSSAIELNGNPAAFIFKEGCGLSFRVSIPDNEAYLGRQVSTSLTFTPSLPAPNAQPTITNAINLKVEIGDVSINVNDQTMISNLITPIANFDDPKYFAQFSSITYAKERNQDIPIQLVSYDGAYFDINGSTYLLTGSNPTEDTILPKETPVINISAKVKPSKYFSDETVGNGFSYAGDNTGPGTTKASIKYPLDPSKVTSLTCATASVLQKASQGWYPAVTSLGLKYAVEGVHVVTPSNGISTPDKPIKVKIFKSTAPTDIPLLIEVNYTYNVSSPRVIIRTPDGSMMDPPYFRNLSEQQVISTIGSFTKSRGIFNLSFDESKTGTFLTRFDVDGVSTEAIVPNRSALIFANVFSAKGITPSYSPTLYVEFTFEEGEDPNPPDVIVDGTDTNTGTGGTGVSYFGPFAP